MAAHEPGISGKQRKNPGRGQDSILEFYPLHDSGSDRGGPGGTAWYTGAIRPLACSEHVIAYERRTEDTVIWCYFNFSGTGTVERLPGISAGCIWANDREAMDRDDV